MIKLKDLIKEVKSDVRQIDTPEFKHWFGYSKVVDSNHNPMIVFHGTKSPPTKFSHKRKGWGSTLFGNYEINRHGIFAAEDPELARWYMNQGEEREDLIGSIMPLYMKIESPLNTVDDYYSDALFNTLSDEAEKIGWKGYSTARILGDKWASGKIWTLFDEDEYNDPNGWIKLFKQLDYDGLKIHERVEGEVKSETWVAFDPNQVKSAYGNVGSFNSDDSDITKENL